MQTTTITIAHDAEAISATELVVSLPTWNHARIAEVDADA